MHPDGIIFDSSLEGFILGMIDPVKNPMK